MKTYFGNEGVYSLGQFTCKIRDWLLNFMFPVVSLILILWSSNLQNFKAISKTPVLNKKQKNKYFIIWNCCKLDHFNFLLDYDTQLSSVVCICLDRNVFWKHTKLKMNIWYEKVHVRAHVNRVAVLKYSFLPFFSLLKNRKICWIHNYIWNYSL